MLWEITKWLCVLAVFAFILVCVFDLGRLVDRLFNRAVGSADESVKILYAEEKPSDPTIPPIIEYASTRNFRQRRR